MKDFPLFTTEAGIASLTLSNIPYTKTAYFQIQDSQDPEQLVKDCRDFCVAVGAEAVYGTGHVFLEQYPFHTSIIELECFKDDLPLTKAFVSKVSKANAERWRELYWDRMREVYNSAYISKSDMKRHLEECECYFVYLEECEVGIGMVKGNEITVMAGIVPGKGCDVLLALAKQVNSDKVKVTVADQNISAMRLYARLGFTRTNVISKWYKIC